MVGNRLVVTPPPGLLDPVLDDGADGAPRLDGSGRPDPADDDPGQ